MPYQLIPLGASNIWIRYLWHMTKMNYICLQLISMRFYSGDRHSYWLWLIRQRLANPPMYHLPMSKNEYLSSFSLKKAKVMTAIVSNNQFCSNINVRKIWVTYSPHWCCTVHDNPIWMFICAHLVTYQKIVTQVPLCASESSIYDKDPIVNESVRNLCIVLKYPLNFYKLNK